MSKTLRPRLLAFGLIALGFLATVSEAKAQNVLGEILRRMDAHNKALQSLRTDVAMERYNSQLKVKDKTSGNAKFVAKSSKNTRMVRLNWEKPAVEQMAVVGDNYQLYRKTINTLYYGKTSNVSAGPGNSTRISKYVEGPIKGSIRYCLSRRRLCRQCENVAFAAKSEGFQGL